MATTISIGIAIGALVAAILGVIYARSIGGNQVKLAEEQVRLSQQQLDADNARRAWEIEQERRASQPMIEIRPGGIAGGSSPYGFNVTLTNRHPSITARGVGLVGVLDGEEFDNAGPMDLGPGEPAHATIVFPFDGTGEQFAKVAGFRARDRAGNEWTWEPVATPVR